MDLPARVPWSVVMEAWRYLGRMAYRGLVIGCAAILIGKKKP